MPAAGTALAAIFLGLLGHSASLAYFEVALRALGTARTGPYFSTAPFNGAAISVIVLGELR
jgi:drug/metabolite transporter (DMT)-like permease